ncbi:putative quinone oxidoreductase [Lasiosphaeria miniovina]|uniref:Quinone oxidoreductase n=1 Tax=Lasiosphaeria miniovina TaxID=1954250 RepID=A0AA40ATW5_9PEZI|nr:putative quinone oxidoreductase [Lasiosphaeria miniovina]KAK0721937.1 putative quinone oxidoreductase [Lasiosphaeria miniovina]
MAANQAAYLHKSGSPLEVSDAPMPKAGPNEIIVKNAAIAINPLDTHMASAGVFVQVWPAILGCDVAGVVHEVGSEVAQEGRFKVGDRVIGHTINLTTGKPQDAAYALYSAVPANKAAILPGAIPFTEGAVIPFVLEAAVCALCVTKPGIALPGVPTPAVGLPYPSLADPAAPLDKTLIVYGGASSAGSMATQLASAAGITVVSVAGAHNAAFSKTCGATAVLDRADPNLADKLVAAVNEAGNEFVGIFDAVCSPETYAHDLAVLARLGGGHLACVHPPPSEGIPENVQAGMIFAVNDAATPVWRDWVTPALRSGRLRPFPPPLVVGKGLEYIQTALEKCVAGVSAAKLVVEL